MTIRNDTTKIRERIALTTCGKFVAPDALFEVAHVDAPSLCDDVDALRTAAASSARVIAAHEARYIAMRNVHNLDMMPVTSRDPGAWSRAYEALDLACGNLSAATTAHKATTDE